MINDMFKFLKQLKIMKASNSQIDKAGKMLSQSPSNNEAFALVNDWRSLHSLPLARLRTNIYQYFAKERKKANIITQRLKRIPTIINKISRMGTMKVSQMQDIGGLRVIVNDIGEVYALHRKLDKTRSDFSFTKKNEIDYIKNPKTRDKKGGCAYRSLHIVYVFHSDSKDYDNLKIELQIRTKKQHYWATAVEVIDIIEKQSIKFGMGNADWSDFFAITSSLFALQEAMPTFEEHRAHDKNTLLLKFCELENKIGVINKLKGISSIQTIGKFAKSTSYALIILDTITNTTNITEYKEKDVSHAYEAYSKTEQKILNENSSQIALLASASEFKKLKEGYLAYFLDVQEFIKELESLKNEFTSLQSS